MIKVTNVSGVTNSLKDAIQSIHEKTVEHEENVKKLSPKQQAIAATAGDPKKIDAQDFAALRLKKDRRPRVRVHPKHRMSASEMREGVVPGVAKGSLEGDLHLCATKIFHEEYGEGAPIFSQHAVPDEEGNIAWYDVEFENVIVKGLPFEEMVVLQTEAHACHPSSRKKMKEEFEDLGEASYSTKAARHGKDIGKRGKNFEKIAASAAKRYGSKKAGERVAGRILANIRAKHVGEEVELKEKHLTPAEMKKREEIAQAIERENPRMPTGKKMAIATAQAKKVAESTLINDLSNITENDFIRIRELLSEDLNLSSLSQQIIALLRMVIGSGALGKLKIKENYNHEYEDSLIDLILASLRENSK